MNNGVNNNLNTQQTNGVVPQQPYNPTGVVPYNGTPQTTAVQQPVTQQPVYTQQVAQQQVPVAQQPVVPQQAVQQPAVQPTQQVQTQPAEEEKKDLGYSIVPPEEGGVDGALMSKLKKAEEERDKALESLKKAEEEKTVLEEQKKEAIEEMNNSGPQKKRGGGFTFLLLLVCVGLGGYIYYSSINHKSQIDTLNYNCTPVLASKEETKLDVNSNLVKTLYSKVETNIREDIAQPEFNDNMKWYLAYRQVLDSDKYDSNCNLFSSTSMEPLICDPNNSTFTPKAFKPEKIILAYKNLFGEDTPYELKNVQLGSSCIGGYQYIAERDEFVQGRCSQQNSTFYTVKKSIVEATSSRNRIVLKEEVQYKQSEGVTLPDYLKSGYYYYVFRLDLNYNYVLVSKTYESKY